MVRKASPLNCAARSPKVVITAAAHGHFARAIIQAAGIIWASGVAATSAKSCLSSKTHERCDALKGIFLLIGCQRLWRLQPEGLRKTAIGWRNKTCGPDKSI